MSLGIYNFSYADQVTLSNTEVKYLQSRINKVNYRLYISLPKGYNKNNTYPVIYLLDSDYSFAIAHNLFDHLSDRKDLPKAILVAIGYDNQTIVPDYDDTSTLSNYKINRTRDYTPIKSISSDGYGTEYNQFSGNASKFKQFFKNELMPYINAEYSVDGNNTIIGHSF